MKTPKGPGELRNLSSGYAKAGLQPTELTIVQPKEAEVIDMLAEEALYRDNRAVKALTSKLLESGYTVAAAARKTGLRASTVWKWSEEPEVAAAIAAGKARRRSVLGQGLEEAAEVALAALADVAGDPTVAPKDRVKAAETILDRCGITPQTAQESGGTAVAIEVDFDERLARIVAGQSTPPKIDKV